MATIVKFKNSKTNITYAYESIPYYDPVKKQSRPKRKYLGRIDDVTGEIISTTGKRGRPLGTSSDNAKRIKELNDIIDKQKKTIKSLNSKIQKLENNNKLIAKQLNSVLSIIGNK